MRPKRSKLSSSAHKMRFTWSKCGPLWSNPKELSKWNMSCGDGVPPAGGCTSNSSKSDYQRQIQSLRGHDKSSNKWFKSCSSSMPAQHHRQGKLHQLIRLDGSLSAWTVSELPQRAAVLGPCHYKLDLCESGKGVVLGKCHTARRGSPSSHILAW